MKLAPQDLSREVTSTGFGGVAECRERLAVVLLRWKALNVKKRLGGAVDDQEPPA